MNTAPGNGTHNNFFYNFWTDGIGNVTYANSANGSYSVQWSKCNNFLGGKGWSPGIENKNITYNATKFSTNGDAMLSVYGWTRDPRVEFYIVENWGSWNPALQFGRVRDLLEVDNGGGRYGIGVVRVVRNALGPDVWTQVWSVRETRRLAGTVNMKGHMDAWRDKLGIDMGTVQFQIVATEAYRSSGEAEVTVND